MAKFDHVDKFPELPISTMSTLDVERTGEWRNMKPILVEKTAPCTNQCPAKILLPHYFHLLNEDKLEEAAKIFLLNNPFPSITGRVCPHFCEQHCNRKDYDSSVSIRALERFLGDAVSKLELDKPGKDTGKKIVVIGSGPAGLTCAYYLRLAGHQVTILEKMLKPGGLLRYGIPEYRLPNTIVDQEIARLEKMGIEFKMNIELGKNVTLDSLKSDYYAVFVATGAWGERAMDLDGENLTNRGLPFLIDLEKNKKTLTGKRCAVIGGGNTAIDVARSLLRLGAEVIVLYRRTKAEMPAITEEYQKAVAEGVLFHFLLQPMAIKKNENTLKITLEKMQLGEADQSGRRRPEPTGETLKMEFDTIFRAIGEISELKAFPDAMKDETSWLKVDKNGATTDNKIFAGGDMVTGPATVIEAIAMGRKAAFAISSKLGNEIPIPPWIFEISDKIVTHEEINTAYFPKTKCNKEHELAPDTRVKAGFAEESATITAIEAKNEISRCFSCGHCNQCGTCYVFCPDLAVNWPGPKFNYDYCKGCGICAAECPGNVIDFIPEEES